MDFGLGEFVRVFEEHFGKKWTKAFVCLLALAIIGFCIHSIYAWILLPTYRFTQFILKTPSLAETIRDQLVPIIMCALVFIIIVAVASAFVYHRFVTKTNAKMEETNATMEKSEQIMADMRKKSQELVKIAETIIGIRIKTKASLTKAHELFRRIEEAAKKPDSDSV